MEPLMLIKYLGFISQVLSTAPEKNLAYLDPGSGSFIFQLIIASLVGGAFIVKTYWKRITGFFRERFSRNSKDGKE